MSILERIIEKKKLRISEQKKILSIEKIKKEALAHIKKSNHLFYERIKRPPEEPIKLVAEIKKASPIKGVLKEYDIEQMADVYVSSGADAISVITEEDFFLGSPEYLKLIKKRHPHIPVLRKDFIFDEYQIYESKILGANALLLIASILTIEKAKELIDLSSQLGLDVLFEVHDTEDLEKAIFLDVPIIGINNRNLKTMKIDLHNTLFLKSLIPSNKVVVSESGIDEPSQIERLIQIGVDAILVGTSIILSESPAEKIRQLKYNLSKK